MVTSHSHWHLSAARYFRSKPVLGFVVVMVCVVGGWGCAAGNRGDSGPGQASLAAEFVAVDATTAQVGTLEQPLSYTGATEPLQQVALRSRVDGQIMVLTVDRGDAVADGEVVASLDADLLAVDVNQAQAELQARQAEVAQARAAVSDAQAALDAARAELQQAQTDADRLARLAAEGAVSQQEAEQAQLLVATGQQVVRSAVEQIRTRQEAVNAAEGRVDAQQAAVDQTQERLSYSDLQSPLAGIVTERLVEAGDYVESGDELLQIGDLSRIKVAIEISDRDLSKVSVGQPVTVKLDAFPDQTLSGRVTRIAPAADPTSQLVPVEITVPNPTGQIGSGLLARVTLEGAASDRIAIPKDALAIATATEPPTLFVVNNLDGNEGTVQVRTVTTGRETEDRIEVVSGLKPGETFVIRSADALSDGQTVRLSILSETGPETDQSASP